MKIAVLSDVHANFVALQAVTAHLEAWKPDMVIVAGDLVNRGPRPLECLNFVLEKQSAQGWITTIGNHEEYVIHQSKPEAPRQGPIFEVHRASHWTHLQLGVATQTLEQMPFSVELTTPQGAILRVTHASLRGTRDGIYPQTTDAELSQQIGVPPTLFLVGHTHIPIIRKLNGTLVVNAGSAGLPFDRNPRPSYARVYWHHHTWKAEIVRVDYDLQQAERDFELSGYLADGGALIPLVVQELRQARGHLGGWVDRYQTDALAGKISVAESARRYLDSHF
jgi:putative phosphoesterase